MGDKEIEIEKSENQENTEKDHAQERNKKDTNKYKKITKTIWIINLVLFVILVMVSFARVIFAQAVKPIIYLYPEQESEITVKVGNPEKLSCSYPKYTEEGWTVIAQPNGDLTYKSTGRNLYSLYWEGKGTTNAKTKEGFIVKGEEVATFLEEKLEILGLSEREAEEFIVYWLPRMEKNKYNYVRFATMEEINEYMPLEFSKKPDTLIRVFMQFKALNNYIEVSEQKLERPERKGFVAVEWGGTELK